MINHLLQSPQIRSIIKARGIRHPRLNGSTYALFRVDDKRHLLSIVSKLGELFLLINVQLI